MKKKANYTIFFAIGIIFFNIFILLFPNDIITASKSGLSLWFNNVLPSLFPFLIGVNMMISLGIVNFIGTILEPIINPIFGVSGPGGFAFISGITSGYPMGAKITSDLRSKNYISKIEAQRLISFCNNSGPLFIIGVVGVGMFSSTKVGYFILLIHYLGALFTGLIFRFYKKNKKKEVYKNNIVIDKRNTSLLHRAYKNMINSQQNDYKFSSMMSDAVKNSLETILMVGGFIVLFSVFGKIIEIIEFKNLVIFLLHKIPFIDIKEGFIEGILLGVIEMTNGCKSLSSNGISMISVLSVASIISFGGFCIHAQSISFLSKTDINIGLYIISKIIHSFFTFVSGIALYSFFDLEKIDVNSVFYNYDNIVENFIFSTWNFLLICLLFLIITCSLIIINYFKKNNLKEEI